MKTPDEVARLAERIRAGHADHKEATSREDMEALPIEVGRQLMAARRRIRRGGWTGRIAGNCPFDVRRAHTDLHCDWRSEDDPWREIEAP
jgi:hypothetical protein